jgi:hypothetical protein
MFHDFTWIGIQSADSILQYQTAKELPMSDLKMTILALALIGASSAIAAPDAGGALPPIYAGMTRHANGKIEVKFVYAKHAKGKPQFFPTHGYTLMPDREKRTCNFQRAADLNLPQEYLDTPLYDPADKAGNLPVEQLPVFFATVVSAEMARQNFAATADESLPYHTCTRRLWEQLLGLKPA